MATTKKPAKVSTPATDAAAPAAKAPSKMSLAKDLYKEIYSKGFDLGGKSQRQVFIARAQSDIGLSTAGANTYFQNITNAERGEPLYKYNRYEGKPGAEAPVDAELPGAKKPAATKPAPKPAPTKAAVKAAEAKVQIDMDKRWQVWNTKKDNQVNSFGTKAKAEEYAAQVKGLEVRDSKQAKAS